MPSAMPAWLFHYYFNILKHLTTYNELLAYIICKKILDSAELDVFNMLNPEKYIFRNPDVLAITKQLSEIEDYDQRLEADLNPYLEACVAAFHKNIKTIKE